MTTRKFKVVMFSEQIEGHIGWICQCIEPDLEVMSQGRDMEEAKQNFLRCVHTHDYLDRKYKDSFAIPDTRRRKFEYYTLTPVA